MSKKIIWGQEQKADYEKLFATCVVQHEHLSQVDGQAKRIAANKARYDAIAKQVHKDMPWWVVGCIHAMECGLSFEKHLHNGDSLSKKTTRVPAGRPNGPGPWTFEESAIDALKNCQGFNKVSDWSLAHVLFIFEGYNGYGYRQYHERVNTPYLWSFTNHYSHGKYYADGKWSETLVSEQIGIAAVIKRLFEQKLM